MKVKGSILVDDMLDALGLGEVPEGCSVVRGETVDFDDVEVDDDAAADELPSGFFDREEALLSDILDQSDVVDLSAAIRRGDKAEAELLLDRVFADDSKVSEWVQLGRFSGRARVRPEAQRKAGLSAAA